MTPMEIFQAIGGAAGILALIGVYFQARQIKDARKSARAHIAGAFKLFRLHDGVTVALRLKVINNGATPARKLSTRAWLESGTDTELIGANEEVLGYLAAHGGSWECVMPFEEEAWQSFNKGGAVFRCEVHFEDEFGERWVWRTAVEQYEDIGPEDVRTVDGPHLEPDADPPPWQ